MTLADRLYALANRIALEFNSVRTAIGLKANTNSPAFTGTPTGITKAHVGLGNVDNTTDLNKPVSTAVSTGYVPKTGGTFTGSVESSHFGVGDTSIDNAGISTFGYVRIGETDGGMLVGNGATSDLVHLRNLSDTGYSLLLAKTPATDDDSNKVATTAFVAEAVAAGGGGGGGGGGGAGGAPAYAATITGDGTATTFTLTHGLSTKDIIVSVRDTTSGAGVLTDWNAATTSTATVTFGVAPAAGVTYRVIVSSGASMSFTNVMGAVNHGATAGTARPTGFTIINWVGSVAPTNAITGDIWTKPLP